MGQRTAIILAVESKEGNKKVSVYHDQWGIGRKPFLNMMAIFHSYYNKRYGKDITEQIKLNPETSGTILEYEYKYSTIKKGRKSIPVASGVFHSGTEDEIEEYIPDFDAFLDNVVCGEYIDSHMDNNNGAMVIHVKEIQKGKMSYETEYEIEIGFLLGHEDEGHYDDETEKWIVDVPAYSKWMTAEEYAQLDINKTYADEKFMGIVRGFMYYFGITDMKTGLTEK